LAKIDRKYLAHFINVNKSGEAVYERLGQDLEEFSPELSAQVETKKNILGESSILISGYEKTASVEPYYAEKGSALFNRLQEIIDNDLTLDELKADIVDVKLWDEDSSGAYPAVKETVFIEVTSYGGDTTGYQIPFTLHYTGEKVKGTFNVSTKTFTAA
jgi:sugar-specific transcriptional regulator TrmB